MKYIFLIAIAGFSFALANNCLATCVSEMSGVIVGPTTPAACTAANGVWQAEGGSAGAPVTIPNPLTGDNTSVPISVLIGRIINGALGFVGSLALVMFIYGGFTWMLAAGNQQRVQKGKEILIWATIGLVVIFTSYAVVKMVLESLRA
jgi:hypothetical protein